MREILLYIPYICCRCVVEDFKFFFFYILKQHEVVHVEQDV